MNSGGLNIPERLMDDVLPFAFVVMMISLIVLPAISFGIARKWSSHQPEIATGALTGAVIVSIVGILCTTFVALVVLGWIPPLNELVRKGG